jgi:hypothetical protein
MLYKKAAQKNERLFFFNYETNVQIYIYLIIQYILINNIVVCYKNKKMVYKQKIKNLYLLSSISLFAILLLASFMLIG